MREVHGIRWLVFKIPKYYLAARVDARRARFWAIQVLPGDTIGRDARLTIRSPIDLLVLSGEYSKIFQSNKGLGGMKTLLETIAIETVQAEGYEQVLKFSDSSSGLKGFIAIHNTTLGPALGGTRIYPYASEDDALRDVLRLSKGMTYKAAIAHLGLGGGKSVIMANPAKDKSKELFHAFASIVDALEGRYICAEDVGCSIEDVELIHQRTPYVVGLKNVHSSGDPSIYTAFGTHLGLKATWEFLTGSSSLAGVKVLVQGLGAVGEKLVDALFWEQAHVIVADLDRAKVERLRQKYRVEVVDPASCLTTACDIVAPCAMGGILNERVIPFMKCRAIAGCANNQLLNAQDDQLLKDSGILYAPDFVINAGGLINVSFEIQPSGYNPIDARDAVTQIPARLKMIYQLAKEKQIGTHHAAVCLGDEILEKKSGRRVTQPVFFKSESCIL